MLGRRGAMALAGAAPMLARAPSPGLRDIAARAGLRYGSDSDVEIGAAPPAYAAAFGRHCALMAANMGWHRVSPDGPGAAPAWEDPNVGFARRQGMKLTGSHLLWHKALPPWFLAAAPGPAAQALADAHVGMMVQHYRGQVFSWNVVNEAIDTDGGPDGMRRSALSERLGPGWIGRAFRAAQTARPEALLAYNDTQFEMDTRYHAARRDTMLRLLDRLAAEGAPIGAVGLQTHLRLDGARFDPATYRRFLQAIAGHGLRILITEMDVFDIGVEGGVAARDAAVADRYRAVLEVALAEPAVAAVVTWGLSDRYTWLTPQTDPSYVRPDGQPARPLPLDRDFQPKPAFDVLSQRLGAAAKRVPA